MLAWIFVILIVKIYLDHFKLKQNNILLKSEAFLFLLVFALDYVKLLLITISIFSLELIKK